MRELHLLDYGAIGLYFLILFLVGVYTMRSRKESGETESFLAADRDMNLFQTTSTTAAGDLGGGFSIAMGGLGFTLGFSAVAGQLICFLAFTSFKTKPTALGTFPICIYSLQFCMKTSFFFTTIARM